jgi:uncharacterized membrane protein
MIRQSKKLYILLFILVILSACATTGTVPMTAKQQATVWMDTYNAIYDDTISVMKNPLSTSAQKDLAQKKKSILIQVWPLLKVYVSVVEGGGVPLASDTATITDLINQLTQLAGDK